MNTIQFKYAIEVERTGSISQAAENLYMAQPTSARQSANWKTPWALRCLNAPRAALCPRARGRIPQIGAQRAYANWANGGPQGRPRRDHVQRFSLSMPRGSYIADGVSRFIAALDPHGDMRLSIKETNSVQTVNNVLSGRFRIGIIRYRVQHESHFLDFLDEKELTFEQLWEYDYEVLLSREHPLATMDPLDPTRLEDYIELTHGDKTVPHLSSLPRTAHRPGDCENRRILIYERAAQFEFLSRVPGTYMWTSPEPRRVLEPWGFCKKNARPTAVTAIYSSIRAATRSTSTTGSSSTNFLTPATTSPLATAAICSKVPAMPAVKMLTKPTV